MSNRQVRNVLREPARRDEMADRQVLTVVVSVVVAPDGRLLYGTVIDVEEGVHGRFQDWAGLAEAAAGWLAACLARDAGRAGDEPEPSRWLGTA